MAKRSLPLARVYGLLEPGPVVLVTTARRGIANIMTMSWQTMMEFVPPLIGCVISGRNYSFEALKATRECVINIPTVELAKKVVACGNTTGRKIDKFAAFDFTPMAASLVKPPLIKECYANLECRIADGRLVTKYNFFILEVVKAWIDPTQTDPRTLHHLGRGVFRVDGELLKLPSRAK